LTDLFQKRKVRRFWDAATREQKMFRYKSCVRYEKYTSNNCHDGRVFVLTFCEYITRDGFKQH